MSITSAPNSPTKCILPVSLPSRAQNCIAGLDAGDPFVVSFTPPPLPFERGPTRAPTCIVAGPTSAYPGLGTLSSPLRRVHGPRHYEYMSNSHHDLSFTCSHLRRRQMSARTTLDLTRARRVSTFIFVVVAIAPTVPRSLVHVPSTRRSNATSMGSPPPFATNNASTTNIDMRPLLAEAYNFNSLLSSRPGGSGPLHYGQA